MNNVTIKDIAKACGVGVSTVSRAINDQPDINPETKNQILKVIRESNYVPNNSARNLKRTESNAIAVLMKGMSNPLFHQMVDIFQREIQGKNYSFILQRVDYSEDEIEIAHQLIKEKKLKGIIFLGGYFSHSEESLREISVPFVLTTIVPNKRISPDIYSSVSVDDVTEAFKMVQHLLQYGYENIAIITAEENEHSIGELRLQGYKKALKHSHVPVNEKLICYTQAGEDPYTMKNGYDMTRKLLESGEKFSAIFAIADMIAVGACKALTEAGLRIPEDVAVAGFDGLDMSYYYTPSITTIKQPVTDMAKETIRIIFNQIENEPCHEHKVFEAKLIVRESTRKKQEKRISTGGNDDREQTE